MSISHFKPLSTARVEWEGRVLAALAAILDCTRSDAQSIADAQKNVMDACWMQGVTPEQAAGRVDRASHPADKGTQPADNVDAQPTPRPSEYVAGLEAANASLEAANDDLRRALATLRASKPIAELEARLTIERELRRDLAGTVRGLTEVKTERDSLARANVHLSCALAEAREQRDEAEAKARLAYERHEALIETCGKHRDRAGVLHIALQRLVDRCTGQPQGLDNYRPIFAPSPADISHAGQALRGL